MFALWGDEFVVRAAMVFQWILSHPAVTIVAVTTEFGQPFWFGGLRHN
jgi:hypothetical protein